MQKSQGTDPGGFWPGVVGGVGGAILLTGVVWVLARRFYRHSHLEAIGSDPPSSDPESGKLGKGEQFVCCKRQTAGSTAAVGALAVPGRPRGQTCCVQWPGACWPADHAVPLRGGIAAGCGLVRPLLCQLHRCWAEPNAAGT